METAPLPPQPAIRPTIMERLRRWRWSALLGALIVGNLAFVVHLMKHGTAAEDKQAPPAAQEDKQPLPINQVVLFSSGVGYFQREGTVRDNARVDLSFDVRDINDLIKSMVVRDLDGGHVAGVSYDSNAPVERTLQSFAIDLSDNPSSADILNQARGQKVEVVAQQVNAGQPGTLTGTIVGIESQADFLNKGAPNEPAFIKQKEFAILNLWCADGLRSVKMRDVLRVRFLNPTLDGEFRKALETLALSTDTGKKAVSINFTGAGKRTVRVGYVVENPIWKTSYRLVLDKENKAAPFLQSWAVVDNSTDEDWKEVRMALVSGRPISFQMDLYSPLYVPRPMVEPELYGSLRPVAYSGGLGICGGAGFAGGGLVGGLGGIGGIGGIAGFGGMPALGGMPGGNVPRRGRVDDGKGRILDKDTAEELRENLNERMELGKTAQSIASGDKLGDSFQYNIDRPVSLPRQKSALLPILNKEVQATRLSIYNESTQAKHPLLGLRLKNTSGAHLTQGPITVFEGSNYAGDARILDLQPNEERLLSYAIDLGTEVNAISSSDNDPNTQAEADHMNEVLGELVDFKGISDPKTSLDEALKQLSTRYGFRCEINTRAFNHDGLKDPGACLIADPEIAPIQGTLATVLKRILARMPNPSGATYRIGRETIEITTNQFSGDKTLRIDPVADRLIPVPGRLTSVKVAKGMVITSSRLRDAKTYTITNHNDRERTVLIEHPVRDGFKLVDTEKPREIASDVYRFEVKVPAGKAAKLVVTEESMIKSKASLTILDDNNIRIVLSNSVTSPKVKASLEQAMKLRSAITKTQQDIGDQERQLKVIVDDQTRLRANLKEMPPTAAAYKRYLEKFDQQETQIEVFQKEIKRLQDIEFGQKKTYEDFLAEINVE